MEDKNYDDKCSLIMLGDAGVGKSTLSISFKSGEVSTFILLTHPFIIRFK